MALMMEKGEAWRQEVIKRLEQRIAPEPNSGCWLWSGYVNSEGYGKLRLPKESKRSFAHRIAYEMFKGSVPKDLELDHLCRVTFCVNPEHLEPVTHKENVRRGRTPEVQRQRQLVKTHCKRGHPYAGNNLYVKPNGSRGCKKCRSAAQMRSSKRLKLARSTAPS